MCLTEGVNLSGANTDGAVGLVHMSYIKKNELQINSKLFDFVNNEIIPGTKIESEEFWTNFEKIVHELAPVNKKLIQKREEIQKKIDEWHKKRKSENFNLNEYKKFLIEIGYLVEKKENFKIKTKNLDSEISSIAGPQLVVPIMNERYALNAANARWVSLLRQFIRDRYN